ncbi:MAG: SprT family zinc-dependent metalloprotease [Candidatus Shapirobacteria bacterium]|nr:SprT family zinc-dependent metalloprotease [Candidatus Shapirobacteria bacterium]
MPTIEISGRQFNYTLQRKSILSLRLRLNSTGSFAVSAPHLIPQIFIDKFISEHAGWIIKNIKTPSKFPSFLNILDKKYDLIISKTAHDSVVVFDDEQKIYINSHLQTSPHIKKLLDKKLRILAAKLIKFHLSKYDFKYSHISVRNQSSRFGSCSHSNNLNFNWQIILFPLSIFQHILLHELCHTVVKNHSVKFWNLLATYDPNYRAHRRWLKSKAPKVMIFS